MSEYCRIRWTVLRSKSDGKVVIVDQFQKRLQTMQRRIGSWAELVEHYRKDHPEWLLAMVTLTYQDVDGYQAGHIREYLNRLRGYLSEHLLGWAWVSELQQRGALHYHMLILTDGAIVPKPDEHGHWEHGMSRIEKARSSWYIVKYVDKGEQKDLSKYPKGARLYGWSVRWSKEAKEMHRMMSSRKWEPEEKWQYLGSSVTFNYAEKVISTRFYPS